MQLKAKLTQIKENNFISIKSMTSVQNQIIILHKIKLLALIIDQTNTAFVEVEDCTVLIKRVSL